MSEVTREMADAAARPGRVVLVGAGDHGRGVLEILRTRVRMGEAWEAVGVVDDRPSGEDVDGVPVLGNVSWLAANLGALDARVVLAIASPGAKVAIESTLASVDPSYATLVHPKTEIAPSVLLEPGAVIGAGAVIVYDTVVERHVTVNLNATIGHHVRIGAHGTVAPGANVLGKVIIGARSQIHANAVLIPGISVGVDATVGAGAVVLRDVEDGVTVFGNPARVVSRASA